MDQMAWLYSGKGGTCHRPLAVVYNIVDLAAISAHILNKQFELAEEKMAIGLQGQ